MATPASRPGRQDWLTWVVLAGSALAVWAIFGNARHFHFVLWDDDHNIQQNPHLGGVTWENLHWMFTDTAYSRRYLPLTWLGWNIDHDLFGLTTWSAHLGNIVFHLLNTLLVFCVIKAALRIWLARDGQLNARAATLAATIGALIWALHPLRVEVVAWASGRIYAQAAFFLLLAMWCYLRSIESESRSPSVRRWRWISAVSLAVSLLTYPVGLSFVGMLLVLDWYLPRRLPAAPHSPPSQSLSDLLAGSIPFLAITLAILAGTLWARTNVQAVGWTPPVSLQDFGVIPRFLQACYVWIYYLWKPLVPLDLSPFYTRLISFQAGDWEFLASVIVVLGLTVILFLQRARWPGLWVLWLCHLLALTPVLGLTEHPHFTNDRYSYIVAVLWSVAVAVVIVRFWAHPARRIALLAGSALLLVALSGLSFRQVAVWQNTETLGLQMIAMMGDHPRRFDIYRRMATALREEGEVIKANEYYVKSLAGDPTSGTKALQQAHTLEARGQTREAFAQYLLSSQLRPDLAEPRIRLGALLLADDRAADALPFLRDAVQLAPASTEAQVTLGWALNRAGQAPEAIPHFETALRQQPHDAAAHSGLGTALIAVGGTREAVAHFEEAVRLMPNSAAAHFQLGLALLDGLGRAPAATAEFERVLKLQPDFPGAREALDRSQR